MTESEFAKPPTTDTHQSFPSPSPGSKTARGGDAELLHHMLARSSCFGLGPAQPAHNSKAQRTHNKASAGDTIWIEQLQVLNHPATGRSHLDAVQQQNVHPTLLGQVEL